MQKSLYASKRVEPQAPPAATAEAGPDVLADIARGDVQGEPFAGRKAGADPLAPAALWPRVFENSGEAIIVIDRRLKIVQFSPAAETLTGIAAAAAMGEDYSEIFSIARRVGPTAVDALRHECDLFHEAGVLRKASGSEQLIHTSCLLLRDLSGTPAGVLEIIKSAPAEAGPEKDLPAEAQLVELRAMTQRVIHQLRNLLGGVAGFASLLSSEIEPGHTGRRFMDRVQSGIDDMERFLGRLNIFTGKHELCLQTYELPAISGSIVASLAEQSSPAAVDLQVAPTGEGRALTARLDLQLYQHLVTLIWEFAAKTIRSGQTVRLGFVPRKEEQQIIIRAYYPAAGGTPAASDKATSWSGHLSDDPLRYFFARKIIEMHGGTMMAPPAGDRQTIIEFALPSTGIA